VPPSAPATRSSRIFRPNAEVFAPASPNWCWKSSSGMEKSCPAPRRIFPIETMCGFLRPAKTFVGMRRQLRRTTAEATARRGRDRDSGPLIAIANGCGIARDSTAPSKLDALPLALAEQPSRRSTSAGDGRIKARARRPPDVGSRGAAFASRSTGSPQDVLEPVVELIDAGVGSRRSKPILTGISRLSEICCRRHSRTGADDTGSAPGRRRKIAAVCCAAPPHCLGVIAERPVAAPSHRSHHRRRRPSGLTGCRRHRPPGRWRTTSSLASRGSFRPPENSERASLVSIKGASS